MNNPNTSTFLAGKFIALGKYQELQKQIAEKNAELTSIVKALGECVIRRNAAEAMLTKLKFQRQENGVWIEL